MPIQSLEDEVDNSYKMFEDPNLGITIVGVLIRSNISETVLLTPLGEKTAPTWIVKSATEEEYLECRKLAKSRAKALIATAQPA